MPNKNKQTEGNLDKVAICTVNKQNGCTSRTFKTNLFNLGIPGQSKNQYKNSKCILEPGTDKKKNNLKWMCDLFRPQIKELLKHSLVDYRQKIKKSLDHVR